MFRTSFSLRKSRDGKDDYARRGSYGGNDLMSASPDSLSPTPSSTQIVAPDPLGLKVIHRPPQERNVDIVFVHGLGGSSRMTWSKNHDLDYFWPLKFLPLEPSIGDARIMTFGYNANFKPGSGRNSMSVLDFAKELLYDLKYAADESIPELEDLRLGEKPIIFLVHSMGGLIVKEAYMQGKDDPKYASIIEAITSIIFLSTPHRGTNLAETLNRILKVSFGSAPMQFIADLTSGSHTLQKLNESFRHVAEKLQIISFYETRPTAMLKSTTKIMVLEKESSVLGYPGEISKPLDADHHGVCKFDGPDDPRYITVRNMLKSLIANLVNSKGNTNKSDQPGSQDSLGLRTEVSGSRVDRKHDYDSSQRVSIPASDYRLWSATEAAKASLNDYLASSESPNRDFNFFRDRWTVGTCDWILSNEALTSWLGDDGNSPRVLWLQGNAASGKSVMSSFIIDKLVRDGMPCHYFFLRFMDQKKRALGSVLRSLAAQMANLMPEYAEKLLDVASTTTDLKAADYRSLWQWFFKESLFTLDARRPIYWVIDGLDEADTPAPFIRLLSDLHSTNLPLRILIVSRKTHDISSAFMRLGKQVLTETIWLGGNRQDFIAYIHQEMDIAEISTYRDQVTAQLLERARGNFLWLHLAVHKINDCHTKLDVERALDDLPSGMHELYDRMALSVQSQPTASDRCLGQRILGWAICAQRTLSIEELRDALRGKDAEREILEIQRTIGDLCGGFVVVDIESKVALIHETAREYLTNPQNPEKSCVIDLRVMHDMIFQRCISCLTDPTLRSLINRGQPPALLDYAISSWSIHLSLGSYADPKSNILDVVVKFLRSHSILVWIFCAARDRALRFLVVASRYLVGVVQGLRRLQDEDESLAQRQATDIMDGWATDLIKIVGKFGRSLNEDPDSIYNLIPPFCPGPSMIYQQFGKKESRVLQVFGPAATRWDDCLARFSLAPGAVASMVVNAGSRVAMLSIVRTTSTIVTYSDVTFEEQQRMTHPERVFMIQVNKLSTLLVSYGYKTTRLWEVATGKCLKVVTNPSARPRPKALRFAEDQVLVSSEDRCIRSFSVRDESDVGWTLKSRIEEQEPVLEGTVANAPTCSAISHDGRMVAYGYRQHPVTVWELDPTMFHNQMELGFGEIDMLEVSSLQWHPLRSEIFCLGSVGLLCKWDPSYDEVKTMTYTRADTFNLNRTGTLVATGDAVGTIKIFSSVDLSLLCQLSSQDTILNLSFSSDSRRLYDVRSTYGIVWEPNTLVQLAEKSEYPESNSDVLSETNSLAMLSLHSEHYLAAKFDTVISLAAQSLGSLYCYGTEDGVARLGEVGRGNVGELGRSSSYLSITQTVWSEDGRFVALSDLSGRLWFKRITRSTTIREAWEIGHEHDLVIPPSQGHITQLVFHPSGDRLLVTTTTKLHCISLSTRLMNEKACTIGSDSEVRWTCHPTMSDYILGFTSTQVHIIDWASLDEVGIQPYTPPKILRSSTPSATVAPLASRNSNFRTERNRLGPMISALESPHILLETWHTAATSEEPKREFLVFEVADIHPSQNSGNSQDSNSELRYTTVPADVSSRIRKPLAFLSRRRLAYLDVDRWICTWRLPTTSSASRRGGTALAGSAAGSRRGPAGEKSVDVAGNKINGIERYYFLPGDWVMANEAPLCTMTPDGTLLCPQNGDISTVQSAKLRR